MPRTHDAFISYSHSADSTLAPALESALERLARPTFRLRAMDVFRDKTSLSASPALWSGIVDHLSRSRWFLLLASPQSAASVWCNKEIAWWLEHRGSATLLIVVTGGEVVWDMAAGDFDWTRTTALPPALRGQFKEEPFYSDLRWATTEPPLTLRHTRFRSVILDLAATIRGIPKDELDGEDVRQAAKTKRLARAGVTAIAAAAAIAIWQAIEATSQRRIAETERDRAMSRMLAAQATELRVANPALSLLLATEAKAAHDSAEAATALLRTLDAAPFERIIEHKESLWSLAVSTDERWAALGDGSGATVRADLASGAIEPLIPGPENASPVNRATLAVAISPDGQQVAAGGFDQSVTIWRQGRVDRRIGSHPDGGFIQGLEFSPDGNALASAEGGRVLLHHLAPGSIQTLIGGRSPEMVSVAFSPDGSVLAAGGDEGVLSLFRRRPGPPLPKLQDGGGTTVEVLAFTRGGAELVAASFDRSVAVYDTRTGRRTSRIDATRYATIQAMAAASDGSIIITGHDDGVVLKWANSGSGWTAQQLYRHSAGVRGAALLPKSGRVATIGFDGRLYVTRGSGVPPYARERWRAAHGFTSAAIMPDRNRAVLLSKDASSTVDIETGAVVPEDETSLAIAEAARGRAAHDGSGRRLLARSGGLVIVRRGSSSEIALDASGSELPLRAARFSPDGRTIYALRGAELGMWDTASGASRGPRYTMPTTGFGTAMAVSADGRLVALARSPEIGFGAGSRRERADTVTVLRADDLQVLAASLESVPAAGTIGLIGESLFFTPDGALLALTGSAGVTLWDLATMQRLDEAVEVPAHTGALGFATNPRMLLLFSAATRALLEVDLDPGRWSADACRAAGRQLSAAEWERYVSRTLPYRPACPARGKP